MELDERRAQDAASLASEIGLRGMDALVARTAREFGATLVTLDAELEVRAAKAVPVLDIAALP